MSHEPFDIDPDEARVRSLMRRSDGPVTVRPLRPVAARPSAIPVALAAAGLLVIGIVVGTSLGARRQEVASPPVATDGLPAPSATHTPASTATLAATAGPPQGVPVSAGPVPEAGVLYVLGSDDQIYRYEGPAGTLTAVSGRSIFVRETTEGVLVLGRHGSADLLRWSGSVSPAFCGDGTVVGFSTNGACAYREADDRVTVSWPGGTERAPLGENGWSIGGAVWDDTGARVALLRNLPGPAFEQRGHNSLWLRGADGTLRQLYEPSEKEAFVGSIQWSPDGRWLTVAQLPTVSNSIAADGGKLLLIEVATGRVTELGTTIGGDAWRAWSPSGELAFIRGAGRQTWSNKRLVVRGSDGNEREIALPDASHVQLAPAWSASGHLAFVIGPSSSDAGGAGYMAGTGPGDRRGIVVSPDGSRREVHCPDAALEGIRPSADGSAYLLLCRAPGEQGYPLSVWLLPPGAQAAVPLVRGIGQRAEDAGGFGYYGQHPHLSTITAWSLAAR